MLKSMILGFTLEKMKLKMAMMRTFVKAQCGAFDFFFRKMKCDTVCKWKKIGDLRKKFRTFLFIAFFVRFFLHFFLFCSIGASLLMAVQKIHR